MKREKHFVAYFYCNGTDFSLGISLHFAQPNLEIHVPFGFFRIGWTSGPLHEPLGSQLGNKIMYRAFGYNTWA